MTPRELACRAVREHDGSSAPLGHLREAPIEVSGMASGHAVFAFDDTDARGQRAVKVYVKVYPDRGASAQLSRLQRLGHVLQTVDAVHPLHIPTPLGVDREGRCLLQAPARGRMLSDFSAGPDLLQALELTGAALARLHRTPASVLSVLEGTGEGGDGGDGGSGGDHGARLQDQIEALMRPQPDGLAHERPELSAQVRGVLALLARRFDACRSAGPATLAHRDVHPRQLFVSDDGVDLIDWDLAGAADPALDLANLMSHLQRRWPGHQAATLAALAQGYGQDRVAAMQDRLAVWGAFHHLRRACKCHRLGAEPMRIQAELTAARQALDAPSNPLSPGVST